MGTLAVRLKNGQKALCDLCNIPLYEEQTNDFFFAIEAFKNYQLKNPNWFEIELLDTDDEEEETVLESIPTDINYSSVTECYQLFEELKAHTFVNVINYQNDEHVLKSSIAETAIILSENSSVLTTDVHYSGSVQSSITAIDVKGLVATKPVAQHALCLQAL